MPGLVNEKTLEINIVHELMLASGIGTFGFTQEQESLTGADVFFPCSKPLILQFKAAKSGIDSRWAKFHINNNKMKNQHRVLDAIGKSNLCYAYYAFPLVYSFNFLTSNFGKFLNYTVLINAPDLTGKLNWISQAHSVEVQNDWSYIVRSSAKKKGKGISAKKFINMILNETKEKIEDQHVSKFLTNLISRLDEKVKQAEIIGNSEHTLMVMGTDANRTKLRFFQLPVVIKGLEEKQMDQTKLF